MLIITLWWVGTLLTDGLTDPKDEKSLLQFLRFTMIWPVELGVYIDSKINQ